MSNVIDFGMEANKRCAAGEQLRRAAPDKIETSVHYRYVLELEHELFDLKEQLCMIHRELMQARKKARVRRPVRGYKKVAE